MGTIIRKNERSWAIDLISEINLMLHNMGLKIKKAGGESTLSVNKKSMFPDVLLFGDENQTQILQGWELKLPDTLITDTVFIKDAQRKAEALNLNSFFIWNFTCGKLYVKKGEGVFEPIRTWNGTGFIKDRGDVVRYKEIWMPVIREIILDINEYLISGTIRMSSFTDTLTDNVMTEIMKRNQAATAVCLKERAARDMVMERRLLKWWQIFGAEYMQDETDLYSAYARLILLSWINRILFAHIIKKYHNCAALIEKMDETLTPEDGNRFIQQMTDQGDFYTVFQKLEYNEVLPEGTWNDLIDLNSFLTSQKIDKIDQSILQNLLEKTVSASKREIRGQFTTPSWLADFLCQITVRDWSGECADPCSGTGTIAKAVIHNKRRRQMDVKAAYRTTWISDKYSYPLQISSIGLTNIDAIHVPIHSFQRNAFSLPGLETVEIKSPTDGTKLTMPYPRLDAIVSNLPFVKANAIDQEEKDYMAAIAHRVKEDTRIILKPGKTDLYVYLAFSFYSILKMGGRLGIIVSNSWLGTEAGIRFYQALLYYYHIDSVVLSSEGKWFKNADVIASILILEKKEIYKPNQGEVIKFCLLQKNMWGIEKEEYESIISSVVLDEELEKGIIKIRHYTVDEIDGIIKKGISLNALFHNISWLKKVQRILVPVSDLFEVKRGERRGWNALFYPEALHGIEQEYLKPVLKSPAHLKNYLGETDAEAFCCHKSVEELKQAGHTGALNWIKKFETIVNGTGKVLPEALKRSGGFWYEMDDKTRADFVTALNPNKRLFVARFEELTFVDQRFTRLLLKDKTVDIRLSHVLLNTVFGMFAIEAVGFGRGLGVLDASSSNFRSIYMLNPKILTEYQKDVILRLFSEIEKRGVLDTEDELQDPLREKFDRMVLEFYGIKECYEDIKGSLLSMQRTRLSVIKD